MKNYTVRYKMKNSKFFRFDDEDIPTKGDILTSSDYVTLGQIKAKNLEDAFYILNMEHPENIINSIRKLAEKDPFHTKYESLHSSMSVNDVLIDNETNAYYFCDSFGWKELI